MQLKINNPIEGVSDEMHYYCLFCITNKVVKAYFCVQSTILNTHREADLLTNKVPFLYSLYLAITSVTIHNIAEGKAYR